MIGIKNLVIKNIRSHENSSYSFASDMNAIVGPNGSGKTTIIETLYTLLQGSSFKGTLNEMLRYGIDQFHAKIEIQTQSTTHNRSLGYQQVDGSSLRKWMIDDKKYTRLPINSRQPVVLFEPDLARLITGNPERRRQYLDRIASQLNLENAYAFKRFERTLRQRNSLLKKLREQPYIQPPDTLFIWNTQLAQLSETIINARHEVIQSIQNGINNYYHQLGGVDEIFLSYISTVSNESVSYGTKLLHFLESSYQRDVALGYTSFGPHRDDLQVILSDQPASKRASRGEVRTVVIALKLLETDILSSHYKQHGIKPTLLLDDVLSELDLVHQERVLAGLKDHQVFITTTDAHALTPGVHTIALEDKVTT
jgi:DNA replication and repair protein RecF